MLKTKNKKINYVPLYSSENCDGIILSEKEILKLTKSLSFIYEDIVNNIASKLSTQKNIPFASLKIIIRTAIIPIIYIFFERFHRINKAKKKNLKVQRTNILQIKTPKKIEDFYAYISEDSYNQIITNNIASIWDEKIISINNNKTQQNHKPNKFINYLSYYDQSLITRINRKLENIFDILIKQKKIPVTGLSQEENCFYKKGFYFFTFKKISLIVEKNIKKNSLERDLFFDTLNLKSNIIRDFLKDYKLTSIEVNKTIGALNNFIKEIIPIDAFEGLTINYKNALNLIKPFKTRYVIFSGSLNSERSFIAAASKKMNKSLVFIQHGGHYGYIANLPRFSELEYKVCDVFLTWGWQVKDNHEYNCKFRPLPSPWLSERKKFWKNYINLNSNKIYDFLWMPQRLDEFTMPLTCIQNTRPDIIQNYSNDMTSMISNFKKNKIITYYKPYNKKTASILEGTHKKIKKIAGNLITISNSFDKGLSRINISNSHIILWDQPGTGFLECIVSGIPTMILSSKYFSKENDEAKKNFHELHKVGVIHKELNTLTYELKVFKENPNSWMNNTMRKKVIQNFIKKYAYVKNEWNKAWTEYLKREEYDY